MTNVNVLELLQTADFVANPRDPDDVEARVAAGFDALTYHLGSQWVQRLDVDRLNVRSTLDCVLGQLFGPHGYLRGLAALKISALTAWHYGFNVDFTRCTGYHPLCPCLETYRRLTAEWRHRVTLARAEEL